MRKFGMRASLAVSMAIASMLGAGSWVGADDERHQVKANLSGFQETPSTLSSPGSGKFRAKIDEDAQTIDYTLSFEGLEARHRGTRYGPPAGTSSRRRCRSPGSARRCEGCDGGGVRN